LLPQVCKSSELGRTLCPAEQKLWSSSESGPLAPALRSVLSCKRGGLAALTSTNSCVPGDLLTFLLWAFLVHRPITRTEIFFVKVAAGLALCTLAVGLPLAGYIAWAQAPYAPRYIDTKQIDVFVLGASNQYALWIFPYRLVNGKLAPEVGSQMVWVS